MKDATKFSEIFEKNKEAATCWCVDYDELLYEVGYESGFYGFIDNFYEVIKERVVGVFDPSLSWVCTDTTVGLRVCYFDGEPLCASYRSARKNSEMYSFVSETKKKFMDFLKEYEEKPSTLSLNLDDSIVNFLREIHAI